MQRLQEGRVGRCRLGGKQSVGPVLCPTTPEQWDERLKLILDKRTSWNMGEMIAASLGFLSLQGIQSVDLSHMVVYKIREMSAADYTSIFEASVNAADPVAFWYNLEVVPPLTNRVVARGHDSRRPFAAARSSSPDGPLPASGNVKKKKK